MKSSCGGEFRDCGGGELGDRPVGNYVIVLSSTVGNYVTVDKGQAQSESRMGPGLHVSQPAEEIQGVRSNLSASANPAEATLR